MEKGEITHQFCLTDKPSILATLDDDKTMQEFFVTSG